MYGRFGIPMHTPQPGEPQPPRWPYFIAVAIVALIDLGVLAWHLHK